VWFNAKDSLKIVGQYLAKGFTNNGAEPTLVRVANGILYADDRDTTTVYYDAWNINSTTCKLSGDTLSGTFDSTTYNSNNFTISPNGGTIYTMGGGGGNGAPGNVQTENVSGRTVTEQLPTNCTSGYVANYPLTGYGSTWLQVGNAGVATNTGNGSSLAVAEGNAGAPNGGGYSHVETMTIDSSGCLKFASQVDVAANYMLHLATLTGDPSQ
jgi:hypothetical protein